MLGCDYLQTETLEGLPRRKIVDPRVIPVEMAVWRAFGKTVRAGGARRSGCQAIQADVGSAAIAASIARHLAVEWVFSSLSSAEPWLLEAGTIPHALTCSVDFTRSRRV